MKPPQDEFERLASEYLKANFQPWDFSGPEPCTANLVALLRETWRRAIVSERAGDCPSVGVEETTKNDPQAGAKPAHSSIRESYERAFPLKPTDGWR